MSLWSSTRLRLGSVLFAVLLLMMLTPPLLHFEYKKSAAQPSSDFTLARVAIYDVNRSDNFGFIACVHLFTWMNASVELISGTEIQQGLLQSFDLLVLPAFGPSSYERELTPVGKERILQFLATGGSLFSVCSGTDFVVRSLGIIDATLHLITPFGVQCHDVHQGTLALKEMQVNQESNGPDLSEEPNSYWVFCTGAAYFEINDATATIPILSYADTGMPGVIVFRYGQGTVFLSSPHPEFEEGDDRDGMSPDDGAHFPVYQNLQDPDSEWGLLYKVSCWLVDTSPGIQFELYVGLLVLISGAFFAVLVVVLAVENRRKR